MGGRFYRVSGVYRPPSLPGGRKVLWMRAEGVLRFQGEAVAREMRSKHVPEWRASKWLSEWGKQVDSIVRGVVTIERGVEGLKTLEEEAEVITLLCNLMMEGRS